MFSNVSRSTAGSLAIASGRRRVARLAPLAACALSFASAAPLHAQSIFSTPSPRQQAESLARPSGFMTITRGKSGTAFFVDDVGHTLTARHAVDDCVRLVVDKEARWICEQAHQQLKEELGLDHFEGRSWHGLHRHALMAMIAYAFLQHRRLKKARRKKELTARPLNRRCRRFATPSSTSSCDQVLSDVRTADPASARKSSVSKSAKVVLVALDKAASRR